MYINDVYKKEEIRVHAIKQLRLHGIKYRTKKPKPIQQTRKYGKKFFKIPLQFLETKTVTLKDGRQLIVPKLVHDMCSFILTKVDVEGIFRKEGSKSRQNEIKLSLDRGVSLGNEHHVIDVAVVLKCFLRELPEPLIPHSFHDLFLRSSLVENKLDTILLACLLLPMEELNLLTYLMMFFYDVASCAIYNKMDSYNLAVVVGPNIFPVDEKAPKSQHVIAKICEIIKLMIDNANYIGNIPEFIIEQMGIPNDDQLVEKRKKKRRSGSLTRMFNGLKKIVSNKNGEESSNVVTPDLLLTPSINASLKKRKPEVNGLSEKKKKDVLKIMPESTLLNNPFTPCRTPISIHPNPRNKDHMLMNNNAEAKEEVCKEKKSMWYGRSRSVKYISKHTDEVSNRRNSLGPKTLLERRWSAVSQAANFKKKKQRQSNTGSQVEKTDIVSKFLETTPPRMEPDYVRVSKTEYEEIKSRVTEIERRISLELDNMHSNVDSNNENNSNTETDTNIKSVQNAYEQTLVQAETLSPSTDQLARRLSRELRIRRTSEQKIIRSPSARKIGSLRRRSRELDRQNIKLMRNKSWHVTTAQLIPRVNLKKNISNNISDICAINENCTPDKFVSRSSFHGDVNPCLKKDDLADISCDTKVNTSNHWVGGETFFSSDNSQNIENGRASLAKLRSQNAGMVLAKAKIFDNLKDSDNSSSLCSQKSQKKALYPTMDVKIGTLRSNDARLSCRVRNLRNEDRRINKKSMSPRKINENLNHRQKLHIAKQYVDLKSNNVHHNENLTNNSVKRSTPLKKRSNNVSLHSPKLNTSKHTPKSIPHIKKTLAVKSPKRLHRTPNNIDRLTPLKVLNTPRCEF